MQLFYIPRLSAAGGYAQLDEEEARHCLKVLRHKAGDVLYVVDGLGGLYKVQLMSDSPKNCSVSVLEQLPDTQARNYQLTIAIAPPKNTERLEWFLEKATEIGIDRIVPMFTERSERRKLNAPRLQKIMVAAMKQSGKALLPVMDEAIGLDKVIANSPPDTQLLIATCFGDERQLLKDAYTKGRNTLILIGPEGDFSDKEVLTAKATGYQPISLGNSRLRLETAGIVACHTINLLNE